MAAPNVIRQAFPKEQDRIRYNELQALKQITANIDLSIRYLVTGEPAFYRYLILPPEYRDRLIRDFLLTCRSGILNDVHVDSAQIFSGGQWNGKIVLFAQPATPEWTPASGFDKSDKQYLGALYSPPPEPVPDEIATDLSKEELTKEADHAA